MATREEIGGGVNNLVNDWSLLLKAGQSIEGRSVGSDVLEYLHSQNVVIKVAKPEPNAIIQTDNWDDSLPYTEYVEVEPLIGK